jgi:hypothetical protein
MVLIIRAGFGRNDAALIGPKYASDVNPFRAASSSPM